MRLNYERGSMLRPYTPIASGYPVEPALSPAVAKCDDDIRGRRFVIIVGRAKLCPSFLGAGGSHIRSILIVPEVKEIGSMKAFRRVPSACRLVGQHRDGPNHARSIADPALWINFIPGSTKNSHSITRRTIRDMLNIQPEFFLLIHSRVKNFPIFSR